MVSIFSPDLPSHSSFPPTCAARYNPRQAGPIFLHLLTCLSPLCIEEFDLSDKNFRPCPCGYQVSFSCQAFTALGFFG